MKIIDSIYGEYDLPEWIEPLIKTPVIQRLRWIALSNISSLTYPMISGVSCYAHSLGVANLGSVLSKALSLGDQSERSLMCAGLLHDAGMPPLGHLTKEVLASLNVKYDYEESLRHILLEEGKRFCLMPDGEKVGVTEALYKIKADSQEVFNTIRGKGKLGSYLASIMDIDKIDNVIRLFRLIHPDEEGYVPEAVAIGYFSNSEKISQQKRWSEARESLHTKLMLSIEDFAQKATIKRLIRDYIKGQIESNGESHAVDSIRFLNDAQFLTKILANAEKLSSNKFYSGKFDRVVTYGWIDAINKKSLMSIKETINRIDNEYYLDFIPDKRFKNTQKEGERGALIGIFCQKKGSMKIDQELKEELSSLTTRYQQEFTLSGSQQLPLI